MIKGLVDDRIASHQLDEAPLTMAEIRKVSESFRFSLVNMLHARIAYPSKREEKESSAASARGEQQSAA